MQFDEILSTGLSGKSSFSDMYNMHKHTHTQGGRDSHSESETRL